MSNRRNRVAVLVPSSNTVMENDLHQALPKDRYTVHAGRMYLVETTREAEIEMIEHFVRPAAKDLATTKPDLLVFGCTSAGSLYGHEYDRNFCSELGEIVGCPVVSVIDAASRALEAVSARRMAVVTPYNEDLTASVARALETETRRVVAAHGMGITVNVELADPTPSEIAAFAVEKLHNVQFDTLFVSCTNFRAMEAKSCLEMRFGRNVVTSNSSVVDAIESTFRGVSRAR
jgi:maleate isomerase